MLKYAVINENKIVDIYECNLTEDEFHVKASESTKRNGNQYVLLCDLDKELHFDYLFKMNSMVEDLKELQEKIYQTTKAIEQIEDDVESIYNTLDDITDNYR